MSNYLNVSIHSEISEFPTEKRYDVNTLVGELKKKLELITGAQHKTMTIQLSIDGKDIGLLNEDDKTLAYYVGENPNKDSVVKLIVKDEQPSDILSGDVPKYTISDDKYQARPDNVRNFIKELREKRSSSGE